MKEYIVVLLVAMHFVLQCQAAATTATTATGKKVVFPLLTSPFTELPKYTKIFGIHLFATSKYTNAKFQYMASIMASLIDNDGDGCADTPAVLKKLNSLKVAHLAMNGSDVGVPAALMEKIAAAGYEPGAINYNLEVRPECAYPKNTDNCACATFEEMTHLVTEKGYSLTFPAIFGESVTSKSLLTKALNIARGGTFTTVPTKYPANAWFTYKDKTCDYKCMATEYLWFGIASYCNYFNNQKYMLHEWKLNSPALLAAKDPKLTAIIKDTRTYRLPTVAPTGTYKGKKTCASGTNHGGA